MLTPPRKAQVHAFHYRRSESGNHRRRSANDPKLLAPYCTLTAAALSEDIRLGVAVPDVPLAVVSIAHHGSQPVEVATISRADPPSRVIATRQCHSVESAISARGRCSACR